MNIEQTSLIITGTQPCLMEDVSASLEPFIPVTVSPFGNYTFNNNTVPALMGYVMSDLSDKHIYNITLLKVKGCRFLLVFSEHLTVPAMCSLLRTHVDDVVLLPLNRCEQDRIQDHLLPMLGAPPVSAPPEIEIDEELTVQNAINIEEIVQLIEEHYCAKLSLARIAHTLNLSPSRISHLFKDVCGLGFRHYLTCRRLEEAETLLTAPAPNITSIAFGLGFSSPSHFCRAFKEAFGITPKSYISGNRMFTLDPRFTRYQQLRLHILPRINRIARPVQWKASESLPRAVSY